MKIRDILENFTEADIRRLNENQFIVHSVADILGVKAYAIERNDIGDDIEIVLSQVGYANFRAILDLEKHAAHNTVMYNGSVDGNVGEVCGIPVLVAFATVSSEFSFPLDFCCAVVSRNGEIVDSFGISIEPKLGVSAKEVLSKWLKKLIG